MRIRASSPAVSFRASLTLNMSPSLLCGLGDNRLELQQSLKVDVGILCLVRPREGIVEEERLIEQREGGIVCLWSSRRTCLGKFVSGFASTSMLWSAVEPTYVLVYRHLEREE